MEGELIARPDRGNERIDERSDEWLSWMRWFRAHWQDIGKRVLVGVGVWIWLGLYPLFLLIIYFATRGFLSYELLTDGTIGINSVFAWTLFLLGVVAAMLWFPLALLLTWLDHRRASKLAQQENAGIVAVPALLSSAWLMVLGCVASLAIWITLVVVACEAGPSRYGFALALVSYSLLLFMIFWMTARGGFREKATNWRGLVGALFLSVVVPVHGYEFTADVIDIGLREFRIGGRLPVTVKHLDHLAENKPGISGRLLLISPRSLYVETGEGKECKLVVLPNTENLIVEVGQPSDVSFASPCDSKH